MHDATVVMSDGAAYCGPVWEWNPREGSMSLSDAVRGLVQIRLVDVHSAHRTERADPQGNTRSIDLLERARLEGWDGT
jgi:hypothetical protein